VGVPVKEHFLDLAQFDNCPPSVTAGNDLFRCLPAWVLAGLAEGFNFRNQSLCCYLSAISLNGAQGIALTFGTICETSIAHLCDQISQITGIANSAFDALISNQAADHQLFDA
jgi:hypothetical protein